VKCVLCILLTLSLVLSFCATPPEHTNPYDPETILEEPPPVHLAESDVIEITENSIEFEWSYFGDDDVFHAYHVMRKTGNEGPWEPQEIITSAYRTNFYDDGREMFEEEDIPTEEEIEFGLDPGSIYHYRVNVELKNGEVVESSPIKLQTAHRNRMIDNFPPRQITAAFAYGLTRSNQNIVMASLMQEGEEIRLRIDSIAVEKFSDDPDDKRFYFKRAMQPDLLLRRPDDSIPRFVRMIAEKYNKITDGDTIPLHLLGRREFERVIAFVNVEYNTIAVAFPYVIMSVAVEVSVVFNPEYEPIGPSEPIPKEKFFRVNGLVQIVISETGQLDTMNTFAFKGGEEPVKGQLGEIKDMQIRNDTLFLLGGYDFVGHQIRLYALDRNGITYLNRHMMVDMGGVQMPLVLTEDRIFVLAGGVIGTQQDEGSIKPIDFIHSGGRAEIIEPQDLFVTTTNFYVMDLSQGGIIIFDRQGRFNSIWTKAFRKSLEFGQQDQIFGTENMIVFSTGDHHRIVPLNN